MNKIFKFRFSGPSDQVFAIFFENLAENLTTHEIENFVHVVLNTRDHKDSSHIFRFFVSHHKKRAAHFNLESETTKKIFFYFFIFWPYEGLVQVGGVKNMLIQFNGCLTTFIIPLIEQKTKFPFFLLFLFLAL